MARLRRTARKSVPGGPYRVEGFQLPEQVSSEHGRSYHSADNVDSGQFSFLEMEAGDYFACFLAVDHKPSTAMTVNFEWKSGIESKDWTNVAKKGSIDDKGTRRHPMEAKETMEAIEKTYVIVIFTP
ncbi:hypothetical protein AgCh_016967 [Apium graveolens]